jgi:hypothetical protein
MDKGTTVRDGNGRIGTVWREPYDTPAGRLVQVDFKEQDDNGLSIITILPIAAIAVA